MSGDFACHHLVLKPPAKGLCYDRQNFQAFHLSRFSGIAVATLPESVSRFNRFRSTSSSLAD